VLYLEVLKEQLVAMNINHTRIMMCFPLLQVCLLLLCCTLSISTSSHRLSAWATRSSFLRVVPSPRYSYSSGKDMNIATNPLRKSSLISAVTGVRGGGGGGSVNAPPAASGSPPQQQQQQQRTRDRVTGDMTILLTSNFGRSSFLFKTQKFKIPRNSTADQLKEAIQEKFPGHPPTGLQTLYLDSKAVPDAAIWGNLTNKVLLPVQLDLMSGTLLYNRTSSLTISKAIDAYVSLSVHEAYLNNKLTEVLTSQPLKDTPAALNMVPDNIKYRILFKKLNESYHQELGPEIKAALEAEKDPSIDSDDISTRVPNSKDTNIIKDIFRRELILNDKDIAKLTFWSSALMVI
jgi:hypothetical protein